MNDAHRYFMYHGMASRKEEFAKLKAALETEQGYLVYYPEDDYCYQYPSVRLKYMGKITHNDSCMGDLPLGKFAGDNIFTPIIDLMNRQQLVYSYSKVSFVRGTFYPQGEDAYVRSISIYLKKDIADATYKEIAAKWNALARYPVPEAIAYMRSPNVSVKPHTPCPSRVRVASCGNGG
jgi:hypothetical protein